LERQYQNFGDQSDNARQKLAALAKADRFTCAGAKQLGYFQTWLTKAGWTDAERAESAASFPVSLDPRMPVRDYAMSDGPVFVYGGVFLPWQDPSIGLDALVRALAARDSGRLMFFGGKHPVYPVDPGKYDQILAAISGNARVSAPGMVPHDTLIENYTRAHVALDLMQRNPERELAFTTRTVEYLWCGLPVIYNDYSELSDLIREYDAGWIVDPADKAATERVIADIFDHPEQIAAKGRNAQRLVSEKLNWEVTGAAIDRFVRMPRMRQHAAEPLSSIMLRTRTLRYLAGEARRHYKLHGARGLWREGTAFLKRQSR
jgi:glycosyltransferase involved in cell wall biosynthesis